MQKLLIGAVLGVCATFSAQAADAAAPFKFVLGAGLTFGGDTLANVTYTDGTTDSIKAGGLFALYGGGEFRVGDAVSLQATIGYHVDDTKAASNGSVKFSRYPVDLLAYYHLNDKFRLGAGAQFVNSPKLDGSGVASNINMSFESTTGVVLEGEYLFNPKMGLKVRAVTEKFKPTGSSVSTNGNHVGVMFNFYL
jgi:opacity protein-like surface antigen